MTIITKIRENLKKPCIIKDCKGFSYGHDSGICLRCFRSAASRAHKERKERYEKSLVKAKRKGYKYLPPSRKTQLQKLRLLNHIKTSTVK